MDVGHFVKICISISIKFLKSSTFSGWNNWWNIKSKRNFKPHMYWFFKRKRIERIGWNLTGCLDVRYKKHHCWELAEREASNFLFVSSLLADISHIVDISKIIGMLPTICESTIVNALMTSIGATSSHLTISRLGSQLQSLGISKKISFAFF